MKIKIEKDGSLWIERAGKMKLQECHMCAPMIVDGEYRTRTCSDSCPCFNEEFLHHHESPNLELCRGYYSHKLEVIDERGGNALD